MTVAPDAAHRVGHIVRMLAANLARVAVALLAVLVLLTVTDVALRYLFAAPIRGAHEVTQILMLGIVLLSLSYAEAKGAHIRVDVLDNRMSIRLRRSLDVATSILGAAALTAMGWRAGEKCLDALEYGDRSSFLEIPLAPHYGVIAFGIFAYALTLLLRPFGIGEAGDE